MDSNLFTNSDEPMENLYSALVKCFAVIICGYLAGRLNLVSDSESKGLNTFIGTFSLPSVIFMSLADLDLSSVNWLFLLAILLAKSIVFFAVIILTLLVAKPFNLAKAGLFAVFCTQSNDFAIGYPILVALYKATHPDYPSYLYLMAPISLAMLNPFAFVLMEIEAMRSNPANIYEMNGFKKKVQLALKIFKRIILNPVVAMTLLGIIGNIIFKHNVPVFLASILQVLGSAFTATALFALGLRMVNKATKLKGAALLVPGILIIVKLIVLPLVTRECVSLLDSGENKTETFDLSTYGFLYGTFPSAPGVFVFATQYDVEIDLIASAMVACTFLSAPLMYVAAKMISLENINPSQYVNELNVYCFDVSIVALIACIWLIIVFIITKKYKQIPQRITLYLIVTQMLLTVGVILWYSVIKEDNIKLSIVQFVIFTTGVYGARIWTALLAISLLFLQCRSVCFVKKLEPVFIIVGWGVPIAISVLLLIFGQQTVPLDKRNPNFVDGSLQAGVSVFLLALCLIIIIGCLVLQQRYRKRYEQYLSYIHDISGTDNRCSIQSETPDRSPTPLVSHLPPIAECESHVNSPEMNTEITSENRVVDIEDLFGAVSNHTNSILSKVTPQPDDVFNRNSNYCPSRFGCRNSGCQSHGEDHRNDNVSVGDSDEADLFKTDADRPSVVTEIDESETFESEAQILRHIVLLILLSVSIFIGLALSVWTLVMEEMRGIYVELAFLDATLNLGQSLIIFAIFGINIKDIQRPIIRIWRKLYYGADILILPEYNDLPFETKFICEQFRIHHLNKCRNIICKDRRYRLKIYKQSFAGCQLIDWLMDMELIRDRTEGIQYGHHLLQGRVIAHVERIHQFHDKKMLYIFEL